MYSMMFENITCGDHGLCVIYECKKRSAFRLLFTEQANCGTSKGSPKWAPIALTKNCPCAVLVQLVVLVFFVCGLARGGWPGRAGGAGGERLGM